MRAALGAGSNLRRFPFNPPLLAAFAFHLGFLAKLVFPLTLLESLAGVSHRCSFRKADPDSESGSNRHCLRTSVPLAAPYAFGPERLRGPRNGNHRSEMLSLRALLQDLSFRDKRLPAACG
ncbi:MAG: hypothetical protein DMG22_05810 [Acidobacteria bacterium]|nr:MAG: hypothetical protein DMG22_05810 [Acidobacteriota bacterium]